MMVSLDAIPEKFRVADEGCVNFVEVCTTRDLWIGEMEAFRVGEHEVLVINVDGRFCAYANACPHQGVSLAKGELDECVLTCRAHRWCFDVRTGKSINPSSHWLRRFPLRIDGDRVMVGDRPVEQSDREMHPQPTLIAGDSDG